MFKINNVDAERLGLVATPAIVKKTVTYSDNKYDAFLISLIIEHDSELERILESHKKNIVDFQIDNQIYHAQYLYADGCERFFYGKVDLPDHSLN